MMDENNPWWKLLDTIEKHFRIGRYIDIEEEILRTLQKEITAEMDREILKVLMGMKK
jgi:hypothetical protein